MPTREHATTRQATVTELAQDSTGQQIEAAAPERAQGNGVSISLEGVSVQVRAPRGARLSLLNDVSLRVPPGGVVALIGPSGAGKTTLMRLVGGFVAPSAGRVRIAGVEAAQPGRILRGPHERGIGLLPQDLGIWDHLRVRDHLRIPLGCSAAAKGLSRGDRRDRVHEMLERLGLVAFATRRAGTLSGGEQRRLALGRALIARPPLLLLDEPFAGLDYALRDEMLALLNEARNDYAPTMLVISHLREETPALVDEVAVLDQGRLTQHGPVRDVMQSPQTPFARRFFAAAPLA